MLSRRTNTVQIFLIIVVLISFVAPVGAQESPFQVLVGVQPGVSYSEIDGFDSQSGFSLGLGYFFASRWGAEIRTILEGYSRSSDGSDAEAYSVDSAAHYYLFRGPKWGFFSAAGLRWVDSDLGPPSSQGSATGVLLGIGADYSLSRRFSLRLDATTVPMELSGNHDRLDDFNLGVGLGFRF